MYLGLIWTILFRGYFLFKTPFANVTRHLSAAPLVYIRTPVVALLQVPSLYRLPFVFHLDVADAKL